MENKTTEEIHEELGTEHVNRVVNILQTVKNVKIDMETRKLAQKVVGNSDGTLDLLEFSLKKGWSADDLVRIARTITALHEK